MSEKKNETKNNPQNDLEGIDVDFLLKVDKLNGKFFETLENLKEARPTFQGIDDAFLSVSENLLNAYLLVYRLLNEQYRGDIERLIAYFEAKNDRIIPFRWKKWWQRRFRQNQAMDLVDREADYEAMSAFAVKEHELYEKYLKASNGEQSEDADELEIEDEIDEDPAEGEENTSINASVSDSDSEALKKDEKKVEGSAENASESDSEGAKQPENEKEGDLPKKRRISRKKEKKGEEENACVGNQT